LTIELSFKKVINNGFIILSGNIGASIFGLLSIAIFTHSMGANIFGYYVLFLTFIEIIDRLFNFQTWQAFIKYASDFQEKEENHNVIMLLKYSFLIDLVSLSIAFLVAIFSIELFVHFFNIPTEYNLLISLLSVSILFNVLNISTGIFRIFDEFKVQSKIVVITAFVKFLLFGCAAYFSSEFEYFVYATVVSNFVSMILTFISARHVLNKNKISLLDIVTERIDFKLLKELKILSFIIYNNFDVALRMISRQLDVVVIGKLYSSEVVGVYRIAKEVSNSVVKLTDPIYQAIYPEFASLLARGKKMDAKRVSRKISFYAGLAAIIFYVVFLMVGEYVINMAFGEEFLLAYEIILVYFLAIFVAIITIPLYPMQHAFGLAKAAFYNQLYATLIYIPLVILLTIEFGMIGASVSYVMYYIFLTVLTLSSINKGFSDG